MKKRWVMLITLIVIFIFCIMGCMRDRGHEVQEANGQDYFNGKVLEVYDGFLAVKCLDVTTGSVNEGAAVHVSRKVHSTNVVPDVKVGDEIRVVFTDVMETYPLQLGTVWAIYALDDEGNVIIGEQITNDSERDTEQVTDKTTEPVLVEGSTESKTIQDKRNWGITLSAEDVTATGMTLVCTQFGGAPTGELQTGSEYKLYILKAGSWIEVSTVIKEYGWDAVAYMIPSNESREFEINWEWLYGELPAGNYRIGKEIMDFRAVGDYDTEWYYAEFEIQ